MSDEGIPWDTSPIPLYDRLGLPDDFPDYNPIDNPDMFSCTLLICGSRDYMLWNDFLAHMNEYVREFGIPSKIISGGAAGTDNMVETYAKQNDIPLQIYPADWSQHGARAGYLRNKVMVLQTKKESGRVLAFQRNKSRGTQLTIDLARRHKLFVKVIRLESNR